MRQVSGEVGHHVLPTDEESNIEIRCGSGCSDLQGASLEGASACRTPPGISSYGHVPCGRPALAKRELRKEQERHEPAAAQHQHTALMNGKASLGPCSWRAVRQEAGGDVFRPPSSRAPLTYN